MEINDNSSAISGDKIGLKGFEHIPITQDNIEERYEFIFAPWVKDLGLCDFKVEGSKVSARLPVNDRMKFVSGAVCGQVIMAAVDTITAMAMGTGSKPGKGTTYQHTHFLRPAIDTAFLVEAEVLRFGTTTAYATCDVRYASSGKHVAHAVLEFAF